MKCSSACRFHSRVTWFSKCLNCSLLTSIDCGYVTLTVQVMSLPSAPQELCPVAQWCLRSCSFKMFFNLWCWPQTGSYWVTELSITSQEEVFSSLSLFCVFQQDCVGFIILLLTLSHSHPQWLAGKLRSSLKTSSTLVLSGGFAACIQLLRHMIMANTFWL